MSPVVTISTAVTSPKVAALLACPDVALAIDAGDTPDQARALSVRGRAEIKIVDGVVKEYLAAARETMNVDDAAEFEQSCRQIYQRMARIAITPLWARYYDFGGGRMPTSFSSSSNRASPEDRAGGRARCGGPRGAVRTESTNPSREHPALRGRSGFAGYSTMPQIGRADSS
ncbi:MAG: pyridoxamine 5'-phosphate oxidase family protein [Nakamurella sp.]